MTIVTRFAPSPTGYLHIGGARTALFSWLYAKKHGGQFVLRIEDTDRERSTQASIDAILQAMDWLGLDYDQGPFYQTQRMDKYQAVIEQLLASNQAYRCTCSKERLEGLRAEQMAQGLKPKYDGHCRDKQIPASSEPFVIRFANPQTGTVAFDDQVYGQISVQNSELDDLIIARSDGSPTYNLTVVVDDWDMGITHVTRGDDHINNTPRQINLLKALGADLPIYAHVPMILGDDGKRLSKRHGAVSVMQFKEAGYLSEAMLNALVRLGWSDGDTELFTRADMIERFDLNAVQKSPAAFNTDKSLWLNQQYLKSLPAEIIADRYKAQAETMDLAITESPDPMLVCQALSERAKTLNELVQASRYFYESVTEYDEKAASKHLTAASADILTAVKAQLSDIGEWSAESIQATLKSVVASLELGFGKVAQPIRVAVTGSTVSPSMDVTLSLLGRETTLERLESAIQYCSSQ